MFIINLGQHDAILGKLWKNCNKFLLDMSTDTVAFPRKLTFLFIIVELSQTWPFILLPMPSLKVTPTPNEHISSLIPLATPKILSPLWPKTKDVFFSINSMETELFFQSVLRQDT